jgi:hypothetical protein
MNNSSDLKNEQDGVSPTPSVKHSRARFIVVHQLAILVFAWIGWFIPTEMGCFLMPVIIGLLPLMLAMRSAVHENALRLNSYLISGTVGLLFGGILSALLWLFCTAGRVITAIR